MTISGKKYNTINEKKKIYAVKGWFDNMFVESLSDDFRSSFITINEKNQINFLLSIDEIDKEILPVQKNQCGYFPYVIDEDDCKLARTIIDIEEILDEIYKQVDRYIAAPKRDKLLFTVDILLSYCQEQISTVHFPYVVGETESGKSSILHLARWLCYRCLYGEDIPIADIYNFLGTEEEGAGTICEDEAQDLTYDKQKIRLYKNSYSKGSLKPIIVGHEGNHKKQVYYKTFCQKWFAGERIPEDKGFRERLAVVYMRSGEPKSNIKRLSEQEKKELLKLRIKLLIWKIQNTNKEFPKIDSGLKQRDQELWEDFLAITSGTKYYEECKQVVKYYTNQRHQTIWASLEARIFELLCQKFTPELEINFQEFWSGLIGNQILKGTMDNATFYPDEHPKLSKNKLSKLFLEKFLANKITKTIQENKSPKQLTVYKFDLQTCRTLAAKYNIELSANHILCGQGSQGGIMEEL